MIVNGLFLFLETALSMVSLIGALEVFVQSTSHIMMYLYLGLFMLSRESHIENIEKKTSRFHWIFFNTVLVSFIFTPWPVEFMFGWDSLLGVCYLRWLSPLLQILIKFYGLVWLGKDRYDWLSSLLGLGSNGASSGGNAMQLPASPITKSESTGPKNEVDEANRNENANKQTDAHIPNNVNIVKRTDVAFFSVLMVHSILWVCLLGHVALLNAYLFFKVIMVVLLLFSSTNIFFIRFMSVLRNVLRKYPLPLLLVLLTVIDAIFLAAVDTRSIRITSFTISQLTTSFFQSLSFLPMNYFLHAFLRRPKQLSHAEYTRLLWKCSGRIRYKTLKMKKLHYYISTNQAMVTKELPTGVTAMMITVPFSSGAMRDAYYIFLQPSNTLYQIDELHHLFYRQEEANNDLVIGKLYNSSTKKAMVMHSNCHRHDANDRENIDPHGQHPNVVVGGNHQANRENEKDKNPLREQMFNDLYMHCKAQEYAVFYNQHEHSPPKSVEFVQAVIFEYTEHINHGEASNSSGHSKLIWIEEKINGDYDKYSNNAGWVNNTRLSPHAFSHFTYHHSKHKLVVVDMQGADNRYTDPQIHSVVTLMTSVWQFFGLEKKEEFGCGNLGKKGIELWKESHICSDLCKALGLPEVVHKEKHQVLTNHDFGGNNNREGKALCPGRNMYVGSTIMALKKYKGVKK